MARMVDVILKVILISVLSLTFSDCQKYSKPSRQYEEKVEYRNYKLVRMYTSGLNGDQNDLYNFLIPSKLKSNYSRVPNTSVGPNKNVGWKLLVNLIKV